MADNSDNDPDKVNVSKPHDSLVKRTFGVPEHAEGQLKAVLPEHLVTAIDWSTLSLEALPSVDEYLETREGDLLYRVKLRGHPAFLYCAYEAQATVDRTMPLRLFIYMARTWSHWLRTRSVEKDDMWPPPPVIPVVLHHGQNEWKLSTQFAEMFELDKESAQAVAPYLPHFEFLLDDLTAIPDHVLRERALTSLAKFVLGALKHGTAADLRSILFHPWQDIIASLLQEPKGLAEFRTVMWYIIQVSAIDRDELGTLMLEQFGAEAEETVMTLGQRLRQEGRQEGRQEDILQVFEVRGLDVSDDVRLRIQSCEDIEILRKWHMRSVVVDIAADIFKSQD